MDQVESTKAKIAVSTLVVRWVSLQIWENAVWANQLQPLNNNKIWIFNILDIDLESVSNGEAARIADLTEHRHVKHFPYKHV